MLKDSENQTSCNTIMPAQAIKLNKESEKLIKLYTIKTLTFKI